MWSLAGPPQIGREEEKRKRGLALDELAGAHA
jgi:hypothetical protein